jgi:hypothetical protein
MRTDRRNEGDILIGAPRGCRNVQNGDWKEEIRKVNYIIDELVKSVRHIRPSVTCCYVIQGFPRITSSTNTYLVCFMSTVN